MRIESRSNANANANANANPNAGKKSSEHSKNTYTIHTSRKSGEERLEGADATLQRRTQGGEVEVGIPGIRIRLAFILSTGDSDPEQLFEYPPKAKRRAPSAKQEKTCVQSLLSREIRVLTGMVRSELRSGRNDLFSASSGLFCSVMLGLLEGGLADEWTDQSRMDNPGLDPGRAVSVSVGE